MQIQKSKCKRGGEYLHIPRLIACWRPVNAGNEQAKVEEKVQHTLVVALCLVDYIVVSYIVQLSTLEMNKQKEPTLVVAL